MRRMKTRVAVVVILALGLWFAGYSLAADSAAKGQSQALCPVMGFKINKKLYVDVEGKRIYVCCSQCLEEVKRDPAPYLAKMKKEGITPENAPVK